MPRLMARLAGNWPSLAGLALLLCLMAATICALAHRSGDRLALTLEPLAGSDGSLAALATDRQSLLLPGGARSTQSVRLRFYLPPAESATSRWLVRVGRAPVDAVGMSGMGWRSSTLDFYHPARKEGLLPSGFSFPLPVGWSGDIDLELHATGTLRGTMPVRVVRDGTALQSTQRSAALAGAIYAALFMLAMITLALHSAARDRSFLLFFATMLAVLVLLAARNGHIYQLPGFKVLAYWRGQGIWALALLSMAVGLQLMQRYSATALGDARMGTLVARFGVALCAAAAACLLGLDSMDTVLPVAGTVMVAGAGGLAVWLGVTAARRHVPMAWTVTALGTLSAAAAVMAAFMPPGQWLDPVWVRYGWQLLLVATASALALGLVARISEYRNQRDHDRLARADSERRMRREAARADLNSALQAKLRTLPAGDVEWAAFRLLLDHLVPQVPVAFATAIAYGFQGQDIRVVVPQAHKETVDAIAAQRLLPLKRHAANGMPLQQPVTLASEQGVVAMEAVVPLPIRSPAWGLLLLHRTGGDGFSTDELALAGEFGRLALLNIEQALSAINLRRSAELDALTGAFNRRTIDQWLVRCFADADRDGQPVSVLFVDMDHFKLINDRHGHAAGDECLREVAKTLRGALADGDLLGRYGGEEFIAVLPGRGGAAGRVVGEQLRAAVERMRCEWEGQPLQLSVSVGVATRLREEGTPAETVDRADKALYTAKRSGRNRVHVAPAVFS